VVGAQIAGSLIGALGQVLQVQVEAQRYERDPALHMEFMQFGWAVVCQGKRTDA
jgi:hypothetical protein